MPRNAHIKALKSNGGSTSTNAEFNVQLVKNTRFVRIPAPGPVTMLPQGRIVGHTVWKGVTVQKVILTKLESKAVRKILLFKGKR